MSVGQKPAPNPSEPVILFRQGGGVYGCRKFVQCGFPLMIPRGLSLAPRAPSS